MSRSLVCYATSLDATADTAMTVAVRLSHLGFRLDLRPVSRTRAPRHCRAVILGGAHNNNHWHQEALDLPGHAAVDDAERFTALSRPEWEEET